MFYEKSIEFVKNILVDYGNDLKNCIICVDRKAVVKLLLNKAAELFGVDFQFNVLLCVCPAAENIRYGERVAFRVRFDGLVYVKLGELVLDLSEIHFNPISYYILIETRCDAFCNEQPDFDFNE